MEISFSTEKNKDFFIKTAHTGKESYYFKVPAEYESEITDLADPFVILLVFVMMRGGSDVRVKGEVSRSLLDNLELFISYWSVLVPQLYKRIKITADSEFDDAPVKLDNKAIMTFSGGLDAAFMLYSNKKGLAGRNNKNIEKCLFIKGFDRILNNEERFLKAFSSCKKMCDDLDTPLVFTETDYRYHLNCFDFEHMAVLAGSLRLWKNYPYQLSSSSYPVTDMRMPWGQNPVTDRFFSSNRFLFQEHDMDFTRTEKAAVIKDWDAFIDNLRVCWGSGGNTLNCGVCEKCIRTHLNFKAAGINKLPTMNKELDIKKLRDLDLQYFSGGGFYFSEILNYVKKHNIKDKVFSRLEYEIELREKQVKYAKLTYYRCLFFSKITFGKRKKHYLKKAEKYRPKDNAVKLESLKREA